MGQNSTRGKLESLGQKKKLFGCPPQLSSERVGRSVFFFFPSHPPESTRLSTKRRPYKHYHIACKPENYMSGIERCQPSVGMSILLHGPLGRSAASAFTTSPATSKSKQSNTSCSDCDILNVLRVERRHVDPLFTCTANPTFCSRGAAMIGMSRVYTTITRSIDFLYKLRSLLGALSRKKKVGLPI